MYYVARNKLGFTESEFWDSSIEKINELIAVQNDMQSEQLMRRREKRIEQESFENDKGEIPIDCVDFL